MKKLLKLKLLLFIIVLVGLVFRVADINNNPRALYGDELTLLLDTNSLLHTGMDQKGRFLPLNFPSGGDRSGGYVYSSIPFVAIFGMTPLGVRALSILSGLGMIIVMFALGKKLFSTRVGLVVAFMTSISFWDISLSRGGFEAHFALFLATFGTYLFFKTPEKKIWQILSALSFAVSIQTYPTYRVDIPIFILILFLIKFGFDIKNRLKNSSVLIFIVLVLVSLAVSGLVLINQKGDDRFSQINLITQKDLRKQITDRIIYEKSIDPTPQDKLNLFHNKVISYSGIIFENYVDSLMPGFLFIHGDGEPRHNPSSMGELFWVDLLFIILGVVFLIGENKKLLYLFAFWITIPPLATSLVGDPHALRNSFMLPPLLLLSALGFLKLWDLRSSIKIRSLFVIILFLILLQEVFFIQRTYYLSAAEYSEFWNYSAKQASQIAMNNRSNYTQIVLISSITNIEFAYPVYANIDSKILISSDMEKVNLGGYAMKEFGNVYIGDIPSARIKDFAKSLQGSTLIIAPSSYQKDMENYSIERGPDSFVTLVLERSSK